MIAFLLACTGTPKDTAPGLPPADTAPAADTAPPDTDTDAPRGPLELARIPDAVDLDPEEDAVSVALTAAPHQHSFVDEDGATHTVAGYAYNGMSPGPTIRARVGDTVTVTLTNDLDEGTTIHWHGVGVPFEMDGVTWMGAPTEPGETFTYTFTPQRAGTFWYHPHFNTDEQVSRGLYGAVVVTDPDAPTADDDLLLIFNDWLLEEGQSTAHQDGDHHATEGTWTVNGQIAPTWSVPGGQTVRVRMLNASNRAYLDLSWPDLRLLGGDQGFYGALQTPERATLAPGDRVEAAWRTSESGFTVDDWPYVHQGGAAWGDPEPRMTVSVTTPRAAPDGLDWPFSGAAPTPDPGRTDITYVFSGSRETGVWLMNGAVFPEVEIESVALGSEVIIEVRNLSPAEHPYHLHGMNFEVLSIDGVVPSTRRVEDTINVGIYGQVRLRVAADNPGDWMTHCHILPHAEGGMMTVLRVVED